MSTLKPVVARRSDAKPIWLFRDYLIPLITPQHTGGHFAMAISRLHPGDGPPPHIHGNEDEAFYVLEGEVTFLVRDKLVRARAGSFVWGPRNVLHNFKCTSPAPAKMVLMVSPTAFMDFASSMAEPAEDFDKPPELTPALISRLMEVAPKYSIEMKLDHPMPTLITDAAAPRKRVWAMGEDVSYLATADDTGGAFTFVEISSAPRGGPPPHAHHREDEIFYVIEGTHEMQLDDRTETLAPGDAVFIPHGTMHRVTNASSTTRGRLLNIHTPGGFDKFFDEVGVPYADHAEAPPPPLMTREQISALLARHGMIGSSLAEPKESDGFSSLSPRKAC
ncbi:MAG TPA: cupin domain-containing protein [Tepidisphaeraceae bacterium]|jgi:quercetin dioxygenase-like cupin family protein